MQIKFGNLYVTMLQKYISFLSSDVVSLVEEVVSREPLVADRREQVHGLITSEISFCLCLEAAP